MREHQTVAYVRAMYAKYHSFNHAKMTIAEAFQALQGYVHSLSHTRSLSLLSLTHTNTTGYVDSSDPDCSLPNLENILQVSLSQSLSLPLSLSLSLPYERVAEEGQLGLADFPQWGLGGDTWVVGVPIPNRYE
jgi:inositol oxygenase